MSDAAVMSEDEMDRERTIHIPLTELDEIPDSISDDGEEFTVTIQGKMKALTQRSGNLEPWQDRGELQMIVEGVKIEGKNVFTEIVES